MKKKKTKRLFVVHMYRWGDEESHSYVEGVYDECKLAHKHGKAEQESRSGKYEYKIWVHPLNEPRMLKYMSDEEIDRKFSKAKKKMQKRHPEWFDKDGNFDLIGDKSEKK